MSLSSDAELTRFAQHFAVWARTSGSWSEAAVPGQAAARARLATALHDLPRPQIA